VLPPKIKRGAVTAPRFPAAKQIQRYLPFAFAFGAAFAGAAAAFGAAFEAGLGAGAAFFAAAMVYPLALRHRHSIESPIRFLRTITSTEFPQLS
jgi:hypothetical protein